MKTDFEEPIRGWEDDSWRLGIGTWDEAKNGGEELAKSLKYAKLTTTGQVSRQGEIPLASLPQGIEFAVAHGDEYLDPAAVLEAVARGLRRRT